MHQAAFSIVCGPLLTFAACKVDVLKNTPLGGIFSGRILYRFLG